MRWFITVAVVSLTTVLIRGVEADKAGHGGLTADPALAQYRELAQAISNAYGTSGKWVAPEAVDVTKMLGRLGKANNAAVRTAVEKLQVGRSRAVGAAQEVQDRADAAGRMQQRVYEDAANGAYSREYTREQVIVNSDGTTRTVRTTETVDESGLPVFGATLFSAWAQANAPAEMRRRAVAVMEAARLEAWDGLAANLKTIYPDAPTKSKAIEFRIVAPDPKAKREAQFSAVNASGRTLTDVTLVVDLVHFITAPEPTVFQVYFIPRWEAGAAIRLPTAVVRNRATEEFAKGRPTVANPVNDSTDTLTAEKRPWLAAAGGLVAVNAAVWAAELRQPTEPFTFPEQAEEGARWEMRHAVRMSRFMVAPGRPKLLDTFWEARAARRVIAFAPPNSDLVRQAKLLLGDPQALFRELDQKAIAAMSALAVPGTRLEGEWNFEVKGFGIGIDSRVQQAAMAMKDKTGRVTMRIDSWNKETRALRAMLIDPADPFEGREVRGTFLPESGRLLAGPTFPNGKGPKFAPEHISHPAKSPGNVQLSVEGDGLVGIVEGYPYDKAYGFTLNLKKK